MNEYSFRIFFDYDDYYDIIIHADTFHDADIALDRMFCDNKSIIAIGFNCSGKVF